MGRLDGKIAWISGAESGIGAATAHLFAAEGASVTLTGLRPVLGEAVAAEINALGRAGAAQFIACDVTREEEVAASIEKCIAAYGDLDIVVNNAGIVQVKMLHDCTEEDWDSVMAVNVKSIFFAVKHAIPYLRHREQSYVVNLGSVSSFVGQSMTPAYTTSKGAVLQLSRSIALDYAADGLRCNCVCPGITDTPMLREHINKAPDPEAAFTQRLRRVPLGRSLTPEDIARAILYFSCEDSAGITGTSLIVDAGYLAAAEWDTQTLKTRGEQQ